MIHSISGRILGLLILTLGIQSCERFPAHYVSLSQCLQEHSSVGEEILTAFTELEEYLLLEGILEDISRESYEHLLLSTATDELTLSAAETAPEVRDFWNLQEEATFGAYVRCTNEITERTTESQAQSIHQMQPVYQQMREQNAYDDPELLQAMVNAITDDDMNFILYRSALLTLLIYMME